MVPFDRFTFLFLRPPQRRFDVIDVFLRGGDDVLDVLGVWRDGSPDIGTIVRFGSVDVDVSVVVSIVMIVQLDERRNDLDVF